jgi:hypothetical protein
MSRRPCRPPLYPHNESMSGPTLKSPAEHQFEAYLHESYIGGHEDHQPDLGGGPEARRPDYRVNRGEAAAIIELKGFETSAMEEALARGGGVVIRDASQELAPVRNKIGEALKQLRPYRDRPEPLIVCLANPSRLMLPSESADDVIAAMYGERGVRVSIVTADSPEPSDGRNGSSDAMGSSVAACTPTSAR